MDRSTKDYEREADQARESLANTLEALRERLQPSNMVDDVKSYAKTHMVDPMKSYARETARGYVNSPSLPLAAGVAFAARSYPLPALLIGTGAWLLMRNWNADKARSGRDDEHRYAHPAYRAAGRRSAPLDEDMDDMSMGSGESMRDRAGRMTDAMREGVGSTMSDAGERAEAMRDAATRRYHDMRDAASGYAESVTERAYAMGERAAEAAGDVRDYAWEAAEEARHRAASAGRYASREVRRVAEEQPLVLAAVGLAIGAALGAAFPATRREREMMGGTARSARRQAEEAAREGYARARRVAEGIAEDARGEMHEQKLDGEGLSEMAGEVTSRVRRAARNVGRNAKRRMSENTEDLQQAASAGDENRSQSGSGASGGLGQSGTGPSSQMNS